MSIRNNDRAKTIKIKKVAVLSVLGLIAISCMNPGGDEESYRIQGKIRGLSEGTVYLQKAGEFLGYTFVDVDSTKLVDGTFEFTGKLEYPEMYYVKIAGQQGRINVFLENSQITITAPADSLAVASILGSTAHEEFQSFLKKREQLAEDEQQSFTINSVDRNPSSKIAPYLILKYLANGLDLQELSPLVANLDDAAHNTDYYKKLQKRLETLQGIAIGQPAPDFILPDTSGTPVSLSSLSARLILIDFWASWCGPCRAENPNLVDLYKRYQDKGFEIIGVGLEFNRDNWIKAIQNDNLAWTNVSAVKAFSGTAATEYGVRQLPQNFLLNGEREIIAKNLRGEALRAFLEKTFGSN